MRRLSQWVGMQSTHPQDRKLRTGPSTPQGNPRHTPLVTAALHVTHYCLPHIGGLEIVVGAETTRLAERGWDVALLSSAFGAPAGVSVENGVRVVRVRAWHELEPRFGVPFPVFSPWLLVAAFREVRRASIVHIHDPLYLTSWVAAFWCLLLRTPYVVHRHVGFVHHSSSIGASRAAGRARQLRPARAGWCLSDPADRRLHRLVVTTCAPCAHSGDRQRGGHCSLPPCSPGHRAAIRRSLGLPLDQPLALFVGRFVPKKGFAFVAGAASDDYGIVFVGGSRPPGLVDPRLHFLGGRPAAEMPGIYRAADVMIVASVGECPLTVLEAMSSGLPVLVNDDPALHSPWTSGPGVQFVDMARGDLREALSKLVASPSELQRLGEEGHRFVESAFSWEAHVDRLEATYAGVLGRGQPG